MYREVNLKIISIVISGMALIISFISLYFSRQQHKENQDLRLRQFIIDNSQPYIKLYNQEYLKVKELTKGLSNLLVGANTQIAFLFDIYENEYRQNNQIYTPHPRHIYTETYELIMKLFKSELSWQTPEKLYYRLAYFKTPNHSNVHYEQIENNIAILKKTIDENKQQTLYSDFLSKMSCIIELFEKIMPDIRLSIKSLEEELEKNLSTKQQFDFRVNTRAYNFYTQLLNFLKLMEQSRINSLLYYDEKPYFPINEIVYIGANISMLNELICRVFFHDFE